MFTKMLCQNLVTGANQRTLFGAILDTAKMILQIVIIFAIQHGLIIHKIKNGGIEKIRILGLSIMSI